MTIPAAVALFGMPSDALRKPHNFQSLEGLSTVKEAAATNIRLLSFEKANGARPRNANGPSTPWPGLSPSFAAKRVHVVRVY